MRFKRALNTTSAFDYPIRRGTMSVVFAFNRQGADSTTDYHGPTRGFSNVEFRPVLTITCANGETVEDASECSRPVARSPRHSAPMHRQHSDA